MEGNNIVILKGQYEVANYKEQLLKEYKDNPFIEALPQIFTDKEILTKFNTIPKITDADKNYQKNVRYHILKRVKNFTQSLPIHFEIERRLSALIRRGYLARNPLDGIQLQRLMILNEIREADLPFNEISSKMQYLRSTAESLSIIGISGIGKTTAIEKLLLMYPQIIEHRVYKGNPFTRTQIVWLKVDCPYDGSLYTLCQSFFKAIDDLLDTRYLMKYGHLGRVTSGMILHMTSLASKYGIGVLVIDEIQHLLNTNKNQEAMLNFFVTISNTVGIPMVLIGTSKAQQLFKGNFRQARRAASEGSIFWDRMSKNSEEWEFFLETLWENQCLIEITPLTDELKEAFYEECQGITAIAVILFILIQEKVIFDEESSNETITVELIKKTSREDMKITRPMITALQNNDLEAMYKYEDIIISLDDFMLKQKADAISVGKIKEAFKERQNTIDFKREDITEQITVDLAASGMFSMLTHGELKKLVEKVVEKSPYDVEVSLLKIECMKVAIEVIQKKEEQKKKPSNIQPNKEKLMLIKAYDKALQKKIHPYELLKEKGFIKSII